MALTCHDPLSLFLAVTCKNLRSRYDSGQARFTCRSRQAYIFFIREAELGPVTILVNNAGVAWQGTLDT